MSEHHVPDEGIDRMLDGDGLGSDAGQAMEAAAALIRRASSPGTAAELGAADATVARFIELVAESSGPTPTGRLRSIRIPAKAAAVVVAATLWSTGVAAAATGHLPDGLQRAVAHTASHVGVDLPTPDDEQSLVANNNDAQGENQDESTSTTTATSSSSTTKAEATSAASSSTAASTTGGTSTATADVSTTVASAAVRGRGPDVTGPASNGLCNAYQKAIAKGHPKNPDAPAWRNLLAAADAACNGPSASTTVMQGGSSSSTSTSTTTTSTTTSSTTTATTVAAAEGEGTSHGGGNGQGGDSQGGNGQDGNGNGQGNGQGNGHGDGVGNGNGGGGGS